MRRRPRNHHFLHRNLPPEWRSWKKKNHNDRDDDDENDDHEDDAYDHPLSFHSPSRTMMMATRGDVFPLFQTFFGDEYRIIPIMILPCE